MKKRPILVLMGAVLLGAIPLALAYAAPAAQISDSHTWAGYAAEGSDFTAISGSWTVPEVNATQETQGDATWIGVGGMEGTDLIQAGTRALTENGSLSYEAWYELLPSAAVPIPMAVHAGDQMHAALQEVGNNIWDISLVDETTGAQFSTQLSYNSSGSSVEWVEEAPSRAGEALDIFSPVTFLSASAAVDGKNESPAALGATGLTLVEDSSHALATPTSLVSGGESFSIIRD